MITLKLNWCERSYKLVFLVWVWASLSPSCCQLNNIVWRNYYFGETNEIQLRLIKTSDILMTTLWSCNSWFVRVEHISTLIRLLPIENSNSEKLLQFKSEMVHKIIYLLNFTIFFSLRWNRFPTWQLF